MPWSQEGNIRGPQGPAGADGADGSQGIQGIPGVGSRFPLTIALGAYNVLTNVGTAYDSTAQAKGLGIAVIDFTGATSVDFRVFCNKVGSGTQSWQLWNVTDASEIAVINDAGSTGDKVLNTTAVVALTGTKVVRIRAKSTTSADDPVYYGSSIKLS